MNGGIVSTLPDFDTPNLARAVEDLTPDQVDALPFGVIRLDAQDTVVLLNKTEAQQSGYDARPARGHGFFTDVAPCLDNGYFKGRIDKARRAGTLDIAFSFVGDFCDREREFDVRVQSSSGGGYWIFHRRSL
jgi:photoactive yellow protein